MLLNPLLSPPGGNTTVLFKFVALTLDTLELEAAFSFCVVFVADVAAGLFEVSELETVALAILFVKEVTSEAGWSIDVASKG